MPHTFLRQTFFWLVALIGAVLPQTLRGQDTQVIIRGVVVDADSAQGLPSVHLRAKNANRGGVTDLQGQFNVRVNATDTIIFTSVGYAPFTLVPADSTSESLRRLAIRMKPQITVLDEVKFKDYGDITKYIRREYDSTVDLRRPKGKPLFERAEPKERKAVQVGAGPTGARLEGAVTAFANLFNDVFQQRKKLKEIQAQEAAQAEQQALRVEMTDRYHRLILSAAALSEQDLRRFTEQYMPSPALLLSMTDYQVTAQIVEHLREFRPQDKLLEDILRSGKFEGDNQP